MASRLRSRLPKWPSLDREASQLEAGDGDSSVPRWSMGVLNDKATLEVPGKFNPW